MSAREEFRAAHAEKNKIATDFLCAHEDLQVEFAAAVCAAAREARPSFKGDDLSKAVAALGGAASEAFKAIRDPFNARVEMLSKVGSAARDLAEESLSKLANTAEVLAGERRVFREVYDSSYSTQTAATSYARASAEGAADGPRFYGVRTDVERSDRESFKVFVYVAEELDVQILKRRSGPDLAEAVRQCWARGANPRVFFPFLPHGFEARHGLDFFGGRTSAKVAS